MIPDGDKTGEKFVQFTPTTTDERFFFNPTGIVGFRYRENEREAKPYSPSLLESPYATFYSAGLVAVRMND